MKGNLRFSTGGKRKAVTKRTVDSTKEAIELPRLAAKRTYIFNIQLHQTSMHRISDFRLHGRGVVFKNKNKNKM